MIPVEHGITPVIGYRQFLANDAGLYAVSARGVLWDEEMLAECRRGGGVRWDGDAKPIPEPRAEHMAGCTCGLYAWHLPSDPLRTFDISGQVSGVVEGYGTVVWSARGWRASHARIVALCGEGVFDGRYACIPWYPTFDAMVAEHPPQVDPATVPAHGFGGTLIGYGGAGGSGLVATVGEQRGGGTFVGYGGPVVIVGKRP